MSSRTGWKLVLFVWAAALVLPVAIYWNLAVTYGLQGLLIERVSTLPPDVQQAVFAAIVAVTLFPGCLASAIVLSVGSWPQRLVCTAPSLFFATVLVYLRVQYLSW